MGVFRVHKTKDFTVLSNHHLRDKELSLQAKGLLTVMLSLPDDWDYSVSGLVAISREGKKAIKSTLDELKERGYLVVTKHPPKAGASRFSYQYDVFEVPISAKPQVGQAYPSVGLQAEHLQEGTQLNTQEQKTNESKELMSRISDEGTRQIIDYLNERAGTRYTYRNKSTRGMINARLSEGFTVEDFKAVIDTKVAEWAGTEWAKFLRPSTLFSPSHFESYLNQAPQEKSILDTVDWSMYQMDEIDPTTID